MIHLIRCCGIFFILSRQVSICSSLNQMLFSWSVTVNASLRIELSSFFNYLVIYIWGYVYVPVDKGGGEAKKAVGGGASESGGSRKIPKKVPGTKEISWTPSLWRKRLKFLSYSPLLVVSWCLRNTVGSLLHIHIVVLVDMKMQIGLNDCILHNHFQWKAIWNIIVQ